MDPIEQSTKLRIKQTALRLFSRKGYDAVSIRDICRDVGIKESTVYYHFQNKKEIFQSLLSDFEEITKSIRGRFDRELERAERVEEEPFVMVGLGILHGYFLEEKVLLFIRMLMIEQQADAEAEALYHRVLFDDPLRQHASVFRKLISMGCFRQADAADMAMEYYAPICFTFHLYFASGEVTDEKREAANAFLTARLRDFYRKYAR